MLQVLQGAKTYTVPIKVFGQEMLAILDTGATVSAVAKRFVPDGCLKRSEAIPLQVGSGEYIYSLGTTNIVMQFGQHTFTQPAVVVDTPAFQAVLGTDFTESEHFGGFLTRPTRILIDGEAFPIDDCARTNACNRLFRLFKTESYTLNPNLRAEILRELEIPKTAITLDVFANHQNHQEPKYLTRENSAWRYNWQKLLANDSQFLWANPPFSQISKVVRKLCMEPTKMILVHPDWQDQYSSPLLKKISVARVEIPSGIPVFRTDHSQKELPSPL